MGRAEDLMRRLEERGLAYLLELVETAKTEESFLDFKQSANRGASRTLDEGDRKTLSRALSGFANSDGGVIIWGVKTSKDSGVDVPEQGKELIDCRRFSALVDDAVSGLTIPPVPGVRSVSIPLSDGLTGYVVTLIPSSPAVPHQAVNGNLYLIRAGSSFVPVTHTVLAGMFGRRPAPAVSVNPVVRPARLTNGGVSDGVGVHVNLTVACVNVGSVVASDCYVSWHVRKLGGNGCKVNAKAELPHRWQLDGLHDRLGSVLAETTNRLAPSSMQEAVTLHFTFLPPIVEGFELELIFGCSGAPRTTQTYSVDTPRLEAALLRAANLRQQAGKANASEFMELALDLLGLARSGKSIL